MRPTQPRSFYRIGFAVLLIAMAVSAVADELPPIAGVRAQAGSDAPFGAP